MSEIFTYWYCFYFLQWLFKMNIFKENFMLYLTLSYCQFNWAVLSNNSEKRRAIWLIFWLGESLVWRGEQNVFEWSFDTVGRKNYSNSYSSKLYFVQDGIVIVSEPWLSHMLQPRFRDNSSAIRTKKLILQNKNYKNRSYHIKHT